MKKILAEGSLPFPINVEEVLPSDAGGSGYSTVVVESLDALRAYQSALEGLALDAAEANPFLEPWMLFPALEAFGDSKRMRYILVFDDQGGDNGLCGFMPLECRRRYHGLPLANLAIVSHPYSFLSTPLLRQRQAGQTVAALLAWFRGQRRFSLLDMRQIGGQGPFTESVKALLGGNAASYIEKRYERAFHRPTGDSELYFQRSLSAKTRAKYRRLHRRLADTGTLETDELKSDGDVEAWIEEFLNLEASGWKAREGTAMNLHQHDRSFFRTICLEGFRRQRLMMMALRVNGKPVAMLCNFLAADGAFGYKTAFDEAYHRFSPGVLLFLEMIKRLHQQARIQWLDACTDPAHFSANHVFADRRVLCNMTVSNGGLLANTAIRALPSLRRIRCALPGVGAVTTASSH